MRGAEAELWCPASAPLALRRRSGSLPSVAPILRAGAESVAQAVGFVQPLVLSKEPRALPGLALGIGWLGWPHSLVRRLWGPGRGRGDWLTRDATFPMIQVDLSFGHDVDADLLADQARVPWTRQ